MRLKGAALALGRRGDVCGEGVLIAMLERSKLPDIDNQTLHGRLLIEEQTEVFRILWSFTTARSKAALEKARTSLHVATVEAAATSPPTSSRQCAGPSQPISGG